VKLSSAVSRARDKARPDSVRQAGRMPSIGRLTAVACLIAAGVIHVSQAPTHFGEWGPAGVTFLALAALEGAFAMLLLARPAPVVVFGAVLLSLWTILLWAWSRTVGIPFGPDAWVPEPIGRPDSVATALEAITAVALLPLLGGRLTVPRSARTYSAAGLSLVLAGSLAWVGVQAPGGCAGHGGTPSLTGPLIPVDGHSILPRTTPIARTRVGEQIGLVVAELRSCRAATLRLLWARLITSTGSDHAVAPSSFWVLPNGVAPPGQAVRLAVLRASGRGLPDSVSVPSARSGRPAPTLVLLVRGVRPGGYAVNGLEIRYTARGRTYLGIYADIARLEVEG
jgi:hypothetical protein